MAYTLKKKYANKNNYGCKRNTNNIKYIVIHYTANDGDTDEGNGNYFANNIVKASAHYFVDEDSITQSVPDNYVAWSVGGSKYSNCNKTGGGKYYSKCTNANSLSIELCDAQKDGKIYPTKDTISNAIKFTKKLMKKYNVPQSNIIRHFDVNGKCCPAYWCGTDEKNKLWKTEFYNKLKSTNTSSTNSISSIISSSTSNDESYIVKIITNTLNVRDGAGTNYKIVTTVKKNEKYTIIEEKNGWGKLKSGIGWINISSKYVKKV